jgi:glycosyltransferase involved in cell wall biosynthesis
VLRRQTRQLREILHENSIDVIYDRTFHMTMIAGPAGQTNRVPRVSTIVSPPEYALPAVESRFVGLKRRRLAAAYRQSRCVIAVSQQAADSAERYYRLPENSVHVIHNPVDIEAVRQNATAMTPTRDDRLTLVCVGRMTGEKGHRDLVEAIRLSQSKWPENVPGLRLWMVGDGPLRAELERQWDGSAGRHTIEFLGSQNNAAPWIAAADALVLPSHFEGMPNVVLEAMALGTPVIATRAGGTMELERGEPTILWAQPRDPSSLADAIAGLSTDRGSAQRRAAAATGLIRKHHDLSRAVRSIENQLESACRR